MKILWLFIMTQAFLLFPRAQSLEENGMGIDLKPVNAFTKIDAPSLFKDRTGLAKTSVSNIVINYDGSFPQGQIRNAFQYAIDIWSYLINSTQTINIEAKWVDLGDDGALAQCAPSCYTDPSDNTVYPYALAEMLNDANLNGSGNEMKIEVNSNEEYTWYYGTDGNTPADVVDFVTIILHEFAHGIGIVASFQYSTNSGGSWGISENPTIYDNHCIRGEIHGTYNYKLTNTATFPNPSQCETG